MPVGRIRSWSRAFAPGSNRLGLVAIGAIAVAIVAGVLGVILTRGGGQASAAQRYGQLPSWLPKTKVHTGRVVQASAAHPQLAIQGDTVSVDLARGRVLATTVGPEVPEDGEFPVPKTSPCSFTVTFRSAWGAVPLKAGAITILDELGHVHHPAVAAADGGPLPARVRPGQTVTLKVSGILPTGGGRLRWAPQGKTIASWDFDVEID
jgi:hypothetical protein